MNDDKQGNYQTLIINLNSDTERFAKISGDLNEAGVNYMRVSAVCGADLPQYILQRFSVGGRRAGKFPGTFACFVSHISCWERAAEALHENTLVLEDDARLTRPMTISNSIEFPKNYDIIFVNNRISSHCSAAFQEFRKFDDVVRVRPNGLSTPGGDGYFISRHGARKLLSLTRTPHLPRHVDQFLCAVSVSQSLRAELTEDCALKQSLNRIGKIDLSSTRPISAYCWIPALVTHPTSVSSVRKIADAIDTDA